MRLLRAAIFLAQLAFGIGQEVVEGGDNRVTLPFQLGQRQGAGDRKKRLRTRARQDRRRRRWPHPFARVSVPTRALSYQTAVLLWRVRWPARAMRAILWPPGVSYAIRRGQFRTEGLEKAQVHIEADGYDAVFDVGNGGLRSAPSSRQAASG